MKLAAVLVSFTCFSCPETTADPAQLAPLAAPSTPEAPRTELRSSTEFLFDCSTAESELCSTAGSILSTKFNYAFVTPRSRSDLPDAAPNYLGVVHATTELGKLDDAGVPTHVTWRVQVTMNRGRISWTDESVTLEASDMKPDPESLVTPERKARLAALRAQRGIAPSSPLTVSPAEMKAKRMREEAVLKLMSLPAPLVTP